MKRNVFVGTAYTQYLNAYLIIALIANILFFFFEANWGDVGFWRGWVHEMVDGGYAKYSGNYPPLYVHWLYLVSRVYVVIGIAPENELFLKFLSLLPIFIAHLALVGVVHHLVWKKRVSELHYHAAMLLAACNTAILMDGPVWGQIDILPVLPVLAAFIASTSERYKYLSVPLFFVGLLTKFQMIAFAPVMGIIFFRHIQVHLLGALLCIPTFFVIYLPFIISGSFYTAFQHAYIDALSMYGNTTMGAANIWILLTGNAAPDTIVLFGLDPNGILAAVFKAKHFGMLLFFLSCLAVFIVGMVRLVKKQLPENSLDLLGDYVFYGFLCAAAFFTFLPAMHERYLVPAAIVSTVMFALNPRRAAYATLACLSSSFNLAMCLGVKAKAVWPAISWVTVIMSALAFGELLAPDKQKRRFKLVLGYCLGLRYIVLPVLVLTLLFTGIHLYQRFVPVQVQLYDNQFLLSAMKPKSIEQGYGSMRVDKSVNGNALSVGNKRFAHGIGTHANSTIKFMLPANAQSLTIGCGIDDESESASIKFLIYGDGKLLWQSPAFYGPESAEFVTVDVTGIVELRLVVDGMGAVDNDHADWLNPVLTLSKD